jgi:hypothetical protein
VRVQPQEKLVAWISLDSCGIINLENNLVKNRPYSFDIFDPNIPRHYLLAANDEKEKEEWVASFSMVLNRQPMLDAMSSSGSGTPSSASALSLPSSHQRGLSADIQPQSDSLLSSTAASKRQSLVVASGTYLLSLSLSLFLLFLSPSASEIS